MKRGVIVAAFAGVALFGGYQVAEACCGALYPPTIENLSCEPGELWPPNHKYVDVTVTADVFKDPRDPYNYDVDWTVASVISNQPDDDSGIGDGETTNDCFVEIAAQVDEETGQQFGMCKLRAERCGVTAEALGVGRTYTILVRAFARGDEQTLISERTCEVYVPHDRSPSP